MAKGAELSSFASGSGAVSAVHASMSSRYLFLRWTNLMHAGLVGSVRRAAGRPGRGTADQAAISAPRPCGVGLVHRRAWASSSTWPRTSKGSAPAVMCVESLASGRSRSSCVSPEVTGCEVNAVRKQVRASVMSANSRCRRLPTASQTGGVGPWVRFLIRSAPSRRPSSFARAKARHLGAKQRSRRVACENGE